MTRLVVSIFDVSSVEIGYFGIRNLLRSHKGGFTRCKLPFATYDAVACNVVSAWSLRVDSAYHAEYCPIIGSDFQRFQDSVAIFRSWRENYLIYNFYG